jgi:hypothetical protein
MVTEGSGFEPARCPSQELWCTTPMSDLVQIRYVLALARTLNFTRAAEACNVTQPALT